MPFELLEASLMVGAAAVLVIWFRCGDPICNRTRVARKPDDRGDLDELD